MRRVIKHLLYFPWRRLRCFPQRVLDVIEQEIAASEKRHTGEIRFAVEANFDLLQLLRGNTSHQRADQLFSQLRVWDTAQNNGVLIYLLLVERRVEIVADRGIDAKVPADFWAQVCQRMREAFQRGDFEAGVLQGIRAIDTELATHFPVTGTNPNELPDRPIVL